MTTTSPLPSRTPVPTPVRVSRLADAAAAKVVDPDRDLPGRLGDGQPVPDDLLSVAGLDLDLTPEQRRALSRAELASMLDMGIRFEAVLIAGFAAHVARAEDLTDPRVRFLLHEIGEETRHQRVFARLLEQLRDTGVGGSLVGRGRGRSLRGRVVRAVLGPVRSALLPAVVSRPALFHVLVLAGEEVPDLVQRRTVEHPGTDPFLRDVNRYHRAEEARHIGYARAVFPEVWRAATWSDRLATRRLAPHVVGALFAFFVRPEVYAVVGLPTWDTWRAANASDVRVRLRHEASRPVLDLLLSAGAFRRGRVPRRWQELCGVDAAGRPCGTA